MNRTNRHQKHLKTRILTFTLVSLASFFVTIGCTTPPETTADTQQNAPSAPLNVLWIIAEDMSPNWGVHGEAQVRTPTLDQLASNGMLFNNTFTTAPVCSTSRSALFTGVHATSIGAHHHRQALAFRPQLPEGMKPITHIFENAGYQTALVTKLRGNGINGKPVKGSGKTDWNFTYDGKPYQLNDIDKIDSSAPFFAQVQFGESHRPFKRADQVPFPADPNLVNMPSYYADHPVVREDYANYLNSIMSFDKKVAYTLDQFDQRGLLDNTVVFIFTDHGAAHFRAKQWVYDSGLKVPLIVLWPEGHTPPEQYQYHHTSEKLVSALDITAQSLDIAQIPVPDYMQGHTFLNADSPKRQYVYAARDRMGEAADYIRSVRDPQFRYIRNYKPDVPYGQFSSYKELSYPGLRIMRTLYRAGALTPIQSAFFADTKPNEELYDLTVDPEETVNLANNPEYTEVLVRMRLALSDWEKETNDLGRIPESLASYEASTGYSEQTKAKIRALMQDPDWAYEGPIPLLERE